MPEQDPISLPAETPTDSGPPTAVDAEALPDPHPPEIVVEKPEQPAGIPVEVPTPMIDIHPPHHGGITRRDFFIHLFTVILGIVIAIGLEQAVEYLHHRDLAHEAMGALINERDTDETANELNIFATRRHQQDLQHDLAILHAVRAHQPLPPGPFIVRDVTSLYAREEWLKIHQNGTINYLTGHIGPMTFRYEVQDHFTDLSNRSSEDLNRAASVLRSSTDPLHSSLEENMAFAEFFRRLEAAHEALPQQEIDAAWATLAYPGNVASLTPDQIDSLERALQIALADDDTMLTVCFTIKRNLIRNPVRYP